MSTDIANLEATAVATMTGANDALTRLGEWVQAARNAHQLVSPLIGTAFVPEAYRPKVDPRATPEQKAEAHAAAVANATAAVLQGITLGLDPLTSLQQIYVVHNRPGLYTEMKVALLKAHGHDVWTQELTDTRAIVCGRRRGTDYVEKVTVTMDQARKAGWTSNQAYAKTPQDMLYARAAGRVCDRVAPDVLMGIASVEEIQDSIQTTAEVGNGHRTVTPRRRTPAPAITTEEWAQKQADELLDIESPEESEAIVAANLDRMGLSHGKRDTSWQTDPTPNPTRPEPTATRKTRAEPTPTTPTPAESETADEPSLLDDGWPEVAQPGGDA